MNTQTTHILLIEDNPGDVRLIAEQLKEDTSSHYELHSEGRLKAGLGYLAKAKVDLILLDLSLPDSQGYDTFAKTIACAPQTPIVMLTVLADDVLAIKAVQAGAQDYLNKGQVSGDLLVRTIHYAIERKQAEDQLRYQASLLANVNDAIIGSDENYKITAWNKAAESLYGWKAEEVLGRPGLEITQTEYPDTDKQKMLQKIKETSGWHGDATQLRKNGVRFSVGISSIVTKDKQGNITGYISVNRDITERKHILEDLRESNERFSSAFEFAPTGMSLVGIDGSYFQVNPAFCEIVGYSEKELLKKKFQEITYPDDLKADLDYVRQMLAGEKATSQMEKRYLHKSGQIIWVFLGVSLVHDKEGKPLYFLTQIQDITKRKQDEDRIQNLSRFPDENPYPVLRFARDGTLLYINQAGLNLLPEWHLQIGQAAPAILREALTQSMNDGKTQLLDLKHGERLYSFFITPIVSAGYTNLYGRDITERKQAEQVLTESENKFRWLYEYAPTAYLILTPDGIIKDVNRRWCQLLGYSREEVLGKEIFDFIVEEERKAAKGLFKNKKKDKQTFVGGNERNYQTKAGAVRTFKIHDFLVVDQSQNITSIQTTLEDITERKQAEKEMRRLITDLRNLSEVEKKNRLFAEALAKNVRAIKSTLNTDEILDSIIDNINNVVPADAINIVLIEGEHVRVVRSSGYQERGLTDWIKQRQFDLDEIKTSREIIRSKKYKIISNTDKSKDWNVIAETAWIKSNIIAPILEDKTVIGFVNVNSTTPDFYSEEHAKQLMVFTDQVSTALKNARLYEATQQRMNRMQAMTQIDQAINSSLDLNVSLEIVLIQTKEQLHADAVDILLVNDATSSLVFSKAKGFKTDEIRKANLGLGSGLPGRAVLERTTVAIPDLKTAADSHFKNLLVEREGFVSYYCVPLIAKSELKGVMEVYFRQTFQADPEWLEFLEMLAQQTAIAINNSELLNSLQASNIELLNAYETTLKGWVAALDMRDHETEGHTQRVTELSLKLARHMGIKDKDIVNFQRGALLHDIGKVAVPDTILNKPGPLTDEEWGIMRRHPLIAFQLLSKSKYLIPALDIPFHHHEKWDGTGYPSGLKGEAIPLAARIFAIVDVWDALISDRPYRKAWTKKKALKYIQEQSGIHFDPEVVKAFLKNPSIQNIDDC